MKLWDKRGKTHSQIWKDKRVTVQCAVCKQEIQWKPFIHHNLIHFFFFLDSMNDTQFDTRPRNSFPRFVPPLPKLVDKERVYKSVTDSHVHAFWIHFEWKLIVKSTDVELLMNVLTFTYIELALGMRLLVRSFIYVWRSDFYFWTCYTIDSSEAHPVFPILPVAWHNFYLRRSSTWVPEASKHWTSV